MEEPKPDVAQQANGQQAGGQRANDQQARGQQASGQQANGQQANDRRMERHAAQAMVAAYVQVARSAQLAHWLQQTRERSLERRAERVTEMREIIAIQQQIDAQQPQAQLLAQANHHYRSQAATLARFARAELTFEDFERMGVGDIVDMEELKRAIERTAAGDGAAAAPAPSGAADAEGHAAGAGGAASNAGTVPEGVPAAESGEGS